MLLPAPGGIFMTSRLSLFKRASRWGGALMLSAGLSMGQAQAADQELLNSSYDIARELFSAYNELFVENWKEQTGKSVEIGRASCRKECRCRWWRYHEKKKKKRRRGASERMEELASREGTEWS